MLANILETDSTFENSDALKLKFISQCDSIHSALKNSATPYLQSYVNQSWPADMFVAMASLSDHDKLFGRKYFSSLKNWTQLVKTLLDPETGMIPFESDPLTGKSREGSRGSSSSLVLKMAAEIDRIFTNEQYGLFREKFVTTTFGLPSVREYPIGKSGDGDIDSGPVIFGVGFSATINSIGTIAAMNDHDLSNQLYKTVNAFGFEITTRENKKYLFGKLPMADAFIAYSRASALNQPNSATNKNNNWRIAFNLYSLIFIFLAWLPFLFIKFRKRKMSL